jgi:hypothetical protein
MIWAILAETVFRPGFLFKANLYITKDLFLPEELEEAIRQENEIAMRFSATADKPNPK